MIQQVLLVSADTQLANAIITLLERSKMAVVHVKSIRQTAEAFRNNTVFDLLIVDLALDDNRLIDLIHFVHHREPWNQIPILVLADLDTPDKLREALKAGASRYITKTFVNGCLRQTIQEMLSVPEQ